jgi:hypothetical protein
MERLATVGVAARGVLGNVITFDYPEEQPGGVYSEWTYAFYVTPLRRIEAEVST